MVFILTISRTLVNRIWRAACTFSVCWMRIPLTSFSKAPLKNRRAQYSLNPCIKTMFLFLKRVTRTTPLQFFGQLTVKNDHSQFLKFFLPLFGFPEKSINFGIHFVIY